MKNISKVFCIICMFLSFHAKADSIEYRNSLDQKITFEQIETATADGWYFKKCFMQNGEVKKAEIITHDNSIVGIEYYKSASETNSSLLENYKDSFKLKKKGKAFFLRIVSIEKKPDYLIKAVETYIGETRCGSEPCRTDKFLIDNYNFTRAHLIRESGKDEQVKKYSYFHETDITFQSNLINGKITYVLYIRNEKLIIFNDNDPGKKFDKNEYFPLEDLSYHTSKDFEPQKAFPKPVFRELYQDTSIKYLNEIGLPTKKEFIALGESYSRLYYQKSRLVKIERYKNKLLVLTEYYQENDKTPIKHSGKTVPELYNLITKKDFGNQHYAYIIKTYTKGIFTGIERRLYNNHREICRDYSDTLGKLFKARTVKTYYNPNGVKAFSCSFNGRGELVLLNLYPDPKNYDVIYIYDNWNAFLIFRQVYYKEEGIVYYENGNFNPVFKK